jgi:hypothetical protein
LLSSSHEINPLGGLLIEPCQISPQNMVLQKTLRSDLKVAQLNLNELFIYIFTLLLNYYFPFPKSFKYYHKLQEQLHSILNIPMFINISGS